MKKYLAVAVILLFIGLAFAPSIHANISKEMVEFTTEVCGLNGGKQTVKLTQEEADEVEVLFDSIRERLNTTETGEEAEDVFKEAVVELDKYGLLGGLSVEQAQRLVTSRYWNLIDIKSSEKIINKMGSDVDWNMFCLIAGRTTKTSFFGFFPTINYKIDAALFKIRYYLPVGPILWGILEWMSTFFYCFYGIGSILSYFSPIQIGGCVTFGYDWWDNYNEDAGREPSVGWLFSGGLNGIVKPTTPFYGKYFSFYTNQFPLFGFKEFYRHTGVVGFTGIKIMGFYLGSALLMKVGEKP